MVVDVHQPLGSLPPLPAPALPSWLPSGWQSCVGIPDSPLDGPVPGSGQTSRCLPALTVDPSPTFVSTLARRRQAEQAPAGFPFIMLDPQTRPRFRFRFHIDDWSKRKPAVAKRCRPTSDVDGPNTSALSCKKRRLRLELITSRLSQPFSLPATHILNREGLVRGDKRFQKMEARANMVKRALSFNASSSPFRRVALLNRTRLHARNTRTDDAASMLSRAALGGSSRPQQQHQFGALIGTYDRVRRPPPLAGIQHFAQTLPTPAVARRSRSPVPSPPVSPRLRPVDPTADAVVDVDDDDDDGESFPTVESQFLYDAEDSEDVYSDFAAIFAPAPAGAGPDAGQGEQHSYEEYLDELDGISWAVP